ncbi:acyl carrier protein [Streptomyces hainanensis]|nr:acyl carrier protein [Streptomyces hainanensis]
MSDDERLAVRVRDIVATELNRSVDEVAERDRIVEDLGADDLDRVEIIMRLEEEFGIQISTEDPDEFPTVGDLVAHIRKANAEA